jgi:hypothetical protein
MTTISASTFDADGSPASNSATSGAGGAIYNDENSVSLTDDTFTGDTVASSTALSPGSGGAVYNDTGGIMTATGITSTGNTAQAGAGGVDNEGVASLGESILAGDIGAGAPAECNPNGQPITSDGYNVATDSTCDLTGTDDQQDVTLASLGLGGLAAHGGPTQTIAIAASSVAANVASSSSCPENLDQRGQPRPSSDPVAAEPGVGCDAGAYQLQPPTNRVLPKISGHAVVGKTLKTTTGRWSSPDGTPTFSYQWVLCTSPSNCPAITGATSSTYQVQSGDQGLTITVDVTATAPDGEWTEAADLPVGPVAGRP